MVYPTSGAELTDISGRVPKATCHHRRKVMGITPKCLICPNNKHDVKLPRPFQLDAWTGPVFHPFAATVQRIVAVNVSYPCMTGL